MISLQEVVVTAILFTWILLLIGFLTKKLYVFMVKRNKLEHGVAVYYNRKIIHIFAGGLAAFACPFYFKTPLMPLIFASILAVITYIPHRAGKLLYWFQVPENKYEVHFCIMWGVGLTAGWLLTGNPWFGVLPNNLYVHRGRRNRPLEKHDVQEKDEVLVGQLCYGNNDHPDRLRNLGDHWSHSGSNLQLRRTL